MEKIPKFLTVLIPMTILLAAASPLRAYEQIAVAKGGSLQGTVTFNGEVPMRKIVPTKDTEICGAIRDVPLIKVGAGNGVAETVVYLKDVSQGKNWQKPKPAIPVLDNKSCIFEPHVQIVATGSDLSILNSDPVLHNTHGFLDKRTVFNVALPLQGMKVNKPLRKSGVMRVECDAHGWMRAWVYVAENPYYALTDDKGAFTITDIPAGDYTLVVWQEETGTMEKPVSIKPGQTTTLDHLELMK